jgi:hypothetical protein
LTVSSASARRAGDVPSVPLNGAIVAICGFSLSLASRQALSDA